MYELQLNTPLYVLTTAKNAVICMNYCQKFRYMYELLSKTPLYEFKNYWGKNAIICLNYCLTRIDMYELFLKTPIRVDTIHIFHNVVLACGIAHIINNLTGEH